MYCSLKQFHDFKIAELILGANNNLNLDELFSYYHQVKPKLKYKDTCRVITQQRGIPLSLRRLKEMCRKKKINRKRNVSDYELREIVSNELNTSFIKVGYRQMTETVSVKYNVNISKNDVRKVLKELNTSDVQGRWRKLITHLIYDTNWAADVYHIDGNDKLKRWTFAIHGCIDGYS